MSDDSGSATREGSSSGESREDEPDRTYLSVALYPGPVSVTWAVVESRSPGGGRFRRVVGRGSLDRRTLGGLADDPARLVAHVMRLALRR